MITTDELASMRATLTASLPDSCAIQRVSQVSDGAGGYTESWATVATVACRVSPSGRQPEERAIADRLSATVSYTVTLPALTDVTTRDRLVIGGRSFEIQGVLSRTNEISRRCVCTEGQS